MKPYLFAGATPAREVKLQRMLGDCFVVITNMGQTRAKGFLNLLILLVWTLHLKARHSTEILILQMVHHLKWCGRLNRLKSTLWTCFSDHALFRDALLILMRGCGSTTQSACTPFPYWDAWMPTIGTYNEGGGMLLKTSVHPGDFLVWNVICGTASTRVNLEGALWEIPNHVSCASVTW